MLEDFITRSETYLDRKALQKTVLYYLVNYYNEADVLQAAKITFPEAKGDTLQEVLQSAAIPKLREQAEVRMMQERIVLSPFFVFSGYCAKKFTYNSVKPLDIIPDLEYNI